MAKHKPHRKKNKVGYRKGDTIHGQKKGKKGEAAAYVTRAQALAKLQVPLADFRRLCILKGIYPRDPKKKPHGMDKTYYHNKDILFLTHEPILNKFFELKTFMKKFKRLVGRGEKDLARNFEKRKPQIELHHLVRERYPAFEDAVRDMDDALSMLALFQALSADQKRDIPAEAVSEATRLYQEFTLYVIRAQALRKVFASIKGYYYQAEICGATVTWLAPHQFAQTLPVEVDFRVMLTFLEFYRCLAKFVNFKLYGDLGLAYPPKRNARKDEKGAADVAALEVEMREAGKARAPEEAANEDAEATAEVVADFGEESREAVEMQRQAAEANRMKTTFSGAVVFINREVPLRPVYFALLCGGAAAVGWERGAKSLKDAGPGSKFSSRSEKITHQIVDRPPDQIEMVPGREYVQPQWVFDCFNIGCLLPIAPYAPGRAPPPHLSPFVDDQAEGYVPRQREILDRFASEATGAAAAAAADESGAVKAQGAAALDAATPYEQFREELQAEAAGEWHSSFQEKKKKLLAKRAEKAMRELEAAQAEPAPAATPVAACAVEGSGSETEAPKPTEAEEERLRAKAMMSKKHKRLLQRIETTARFKSEKNEGLRKKRRMHEKGEKAS